MKRDSMCGYYPIPNDHPIFVMLKHEIENLRKKCQELEIGKAMYHRHVQLLTKEVPREISRKIHKKLWG